MTNHDVLPFDTLHNLKHQSGTLANIPNAPEGDGDTYWAEDSEQLFISNEDATGWVVTTFITSLSELSDVDATLAPSDGDTIIYNSLTTQYESGLLDYEFISEDTGATLTLSGIDTTGYDGLLLICSLRLDGAHATSSKSDRLGSLSINGGASITGGFYREWSDEHGNNEGSATLNQAFIYPDNDDLDTENYGSAWVNFDFDPGLDDDARSVHCSIHNMSIVSDSNTATTQRWYRETFFGFAETVRDVTSLTIAPTSGSWTTGSIIRLFGRRSKE